MHRPWTRSYPPGVSAEIDADAFTDIAALTDVAIATFSQRPALRSFGAQLTYRRLDALADAFAAYLAKDCGLAPGARFAIISPNLLQYPVALLGALRAGLVVVNVNPLYTPPELAFQLADSGAEAVLICDVVTAALAKALPQTRVRRVIVTGVGDLIPGPRGWLVSHLARRKAKAHLAPIDGAIPFRSAVRRRPPFQRPAVRGEDLAFLQYTGGTTGRPKGAMLTHRNIVANVAQTFSMLDAGMAQGVEPGDRIVTPLPLYHIYALLVALGMMGRGVENVLIANPRDIGALVKTLKPLKMRCIFGINTLFAALMNHRDFRDVDFSRLNLTIAGGAATQAAVAQRWQAITGCAICEGYGLSETSPVVSVTPGGAVPAFTGACGPPVPGLDLRLVKDDGEAAPEGETGEICVRGPNVMRGYWNQPAETALAIDAEGWFRTGDIGRLDPDGRLRIVDRKKDMVLVSGFSVYPSEVEDVLAQHPGVAEAAVVGQPNETTGEAVVAVVVRLDPNLTVEALAAFWRERLAAYKRPRRVEFVEALPKTPVGKVLRREVRDRLARSADR